MKVLIDTNVLVSALMNFNANPGKILSLILNLKVKIVYDNRILFEYIDVISREKFGFDEEIISGLINFIKDEGAFANANPINIKFEDESDKKFYELFKTANVDYLVTGNKKHFPKEKGIVSPREFLDLY